MTDTGSWCLEPWLNTIILLQKTLQDGREKIELDQSADLLAYYFQVTSDHLSALLPTISYMHQNASHFDFRFIPANGFRSLLFVLDTCLQRISDICSSVLNNNDSYFFFQKSAKIRDLEEYIQVLGGLRSMSDYSRKLMQELIGRGSLFISDDSELIPAFVEEIERINQEVFYGRSLGFQYCGSISDAIRTVEVAMMVCADTYFERRKIMPDFGAVASTIPGLKSVLKMSLNPEARSKLLVSTTRNPNIHFCQQFWNLTGAWYLYAWHNLFVPKVAVNRVIEMQPELLTVQGLKEQPVYFKPASWKRPVFGRLISSQVRQGQEAPGTGSSSLQKSPYLIFHCHGGGFIAQSSKVHEVYLLKWAVDLDIPILSIDYSLAPEHPYPEPLNEVTFAYAWALNNADALGWTGEHICFVGDSAGGMLLVAAALTLSCMDVRLPDGILTVYAPFLVQYAPSPSRVMCVMDPLLPLGIMVRCLSSYGYRFPEPTDVGSVQGINDRIDERSRRHKTVKMSPSDSVGMSEVPLLNNSVDREVFNDSLPSPLDADCVRDKVDRGAEIVAQDNKGELSGQWRFPGVFPLTMGLLGKSLHVASAGVPLNTSRTLKSAPDLSWPPAKAEPLRRHQFPSLSADDPFLSPLWADDDLLRGLPPMFIVACHLDPLLDDSIVLARRLDQIDHPVRLDVLGDLPHGFLSMALMSKEAMDGADLCLERIRDIFGLSSTNGG